MGLDLSPCVGISFSVSDSVCHPLSCLSNIWRLANPSAIPVPCREGMGSRGMQESQMPSISWGRGLLATGDQHPLLKLIFLVPSPREYRGIPSSARLYCVLLGDSNSRTQWAEVFRLLLLLVSNQCYLLNKNLKQTLGQLHNLETNWEL